MKIPKEAEIIDYDDYSVLENLISRTHSIVRIYLKKRYCNFSDLKYTQKCIELSNDVNFDYYYCRMNKIYESPVGDIIFFIKSQIRL